VSPVEIAAHLDIGILAETAPPVPGQVPAGMWCGPLMTETERWRIERYRYSFSIESHVHVALHVKRVNGVLRPIRAKADLAHPPIVEFTPSG